MVAEGLAIPLVYVELAEEEAVMVADGILPHAGEEVALADEDADIVADSLLIPAV
jgi:hypothetical protein